MISLYSGTPGSGKSLHVARTIYYRVRVGKPVICNFCINADLIKTKKKKLFLYCDNLSLNPKMLVEYSKDYWHGKRVQEDAILLVIDESQILFNSRDWGQRGRNDWLTFFSQHRKYGYEIVLIAQFDRMLDRQIRSLVEYEYIHRKVNNYGVGGMILGLLAGGKLFVCIKMWYPLHERLGSEFYKAKKRYYELYDTYSEFTSG